MGTPGPKRKGPDLKVDLSKEETSSNKSEDHLADVLSKLKIDSKGYKASDFEDISVLGSGASGIVHKSKHNPTGNIMAKKVIKISTTEAERKALEKELEFMKGFNSPNIVAFYGAFLTDSEIHVCMEYMDVGSFDVIYHKLGTIPEEHLGKIALSVLEGLVYLYKTYKVVHRDIKPSNMVLNSRGHVKLCDFGVSGVIMDSCKGGLETFVGTSFYMSPARIQGKGYGTQSDSWSVGLSLVEMAIGKFPYELKQDPNPKKPVGGVFDLINMIVLKPPPSLPKDGFSPEFQDFIGKCLIKDDDARETPLQLLSHPFMVKAKGLKVDMSAWAHTILELA